MASTVVVKVKVEELSKYGFKANGKYVGLSKHLPEVDKTRIVPGAVFEAEYYVADSGKEYLNKILAAGSDSQPVEQPKAAMMQSEVDTERAKRFVPKFTKKVEDTEKMTKADWSAKDRSQLIGGLSHDAATITAQMLTLQAFNNTEEILKCYKQVLEGMLKIREELK